MKVVLLILITSLQLVAAKTSAQRISLQAKNEKLDEVFKSITTQSNFKFLYNDEVITKHPRVSLEVKNEPLDAVLSKLLPKGLFEYKIVSNTILVNVVSKAANETTIVQTKASGIVVDENGNPISNASVILVGSNTVVVSDKDGKFQIQANVGNTLEARYVGYQSARVTVSSINNIRIVLRSDASTNIEEVNVVATGYQNIERKHFTGATSKIDAKEAERAGVPDISRMLEGQAAGVSVQNVSGTFGAAPKIRVRGATSITGDNKPLWVIDGVILDEAVNISNEALSTGDANTLLGSSVAGLNPDDIESITVLKDAAATAMYGAAAMNGVVVVNTKKGRITDGNPQFNYSGNYTTYFKPTYNQFDIMNSAEQMKLIIDMENKGFLNHSQVSRAATGGVFTKMYNLMYEYDPINDSFALRNDAPSRYEFLQRYANANTNWFDLLFKNNLVHDHSLSVSTGSNKAQTYASTSFMNDPGYTLGNEAKRFTANIRNNYKISDKLSTELIFQGNIRDQRAPGTLNRQSDAVYGSYSRDFDINPYSYSLNTSRIITAFDENGDREFFQRDYAPFNILNEIDNNYIKLKLMDIKVQGGVTYKILPSLTYSVNGMYRYYNSERQHIITEYANLSKAYRANQDQTVNSGNRFLYADPDFPNTDKFVILPNGGFFNLSNNNMISYYMRHNLEYNQQWNKHSLNFFGNYELQFADKQSHDFNGPGIEYDNGNLVLPTYRYYKKTIESGSELFAMKYNYDRKLAYALRGAYNFDDKYSFNFTTRYDGSNKMGKSTVARWLPTWNISGAWDIDKERFFNQNNKYFTGARIRGTYGLTANIGNASNSTAVFYNSITYRPYESEKEGKISISGLENSELTWEKMYELNLGADLSFFNNRVDLNVDYYRRNIFDLIGLIRTSGIGGQFEKWANYADMKGHGVDIQLGGYPFKNSDGFTWRTQFTLGFNETEITKLDVTRNIWNLISAEGGAMKGRPFRGLYSIDFDKLAERGGYPTYIGADGTAGTTYFWLQDTETEFLKYNGPVDPKTTGGFYNRLEYKNFNLSFLVKFAFGSMVRLQPTYSASYLDYFNVSRDLINRFIYSGDEYLTVIPSVLDGLTTEFDVKNSEGERNDASYTYNAYNYSSERVAKGDYVRLSQVTFGYNLPKEIVSKFKFRSAQFNLVGNNLLLFYSDKKLNGVDPEFYSNGGVALPMPKQITLSIKLGF
ncbi:MAG: SusC/RagA family TonB-linked outer membrane protein [Sphingobacterium composti]